MSVLIEEVDTSALDSLLLKVYRKGGYDFREFKPGPIARRLKQRLLATGTTTYHDYSRFLDTHPDEYGLLAETLVITNSGFFRNSYTYRQAAEIILPVLIRDKRNGNNKHLKIWSNACACGEEPYSVAILIAEALGNSPSDLKITIHSTDISSRSLSVATAGRFSPDSLKNVPSPLLRKYFNIGDGHYYVKDIIRSMLSISHFDLTSTAQSPFTRLDCVFCRNVLIYMKQELQERILNMLYDSLGESGFLVLGETETPGYNMREKFECIDEIAKIYRKK